MEVLAVVVLAVAVVVAVAVALVDPCCRHSRKGRWVGFPFFSEYIFKKLDRVVCSEVGGHLYIFYR